MRAGSKKLGSLSCSGDQGASSPESRHRISSPTSSGEADHASLKTRGNPIGFFNNLLLDISDYLQFDNFSHSNKREQVEWLTHAMREDTRSKRLATAIEWMAEVSVCNRKYVRK